MIEVYLTALLEARNPDGGWGAVAGRPSNTESTALAALALRAAAVPAAAEAARRWLVENQAADGSWPLVPPDTAPRSWASCLAVLALAAFGGTDRAALAGARWILSHEGRGLDWLIRLFLVFFPERRPREIDMELKGWPWMEDTFSWVEPTAYALVALKRLRPHLRGRRLDDRIRAGELMLYDRMCEGGGWNYGNAVVLGERLWPYPDTTALALIALRDVASRAENRAGLAALEAMLERNGSGLTLALASLCFALYGRDARRLHRRMADAFQNNGFLGETRPLALAALAAAGGETLLRV